MIAGDDKGPGWAFTVGLWHTHRSPELAMFGLDVGNMKTCLNALGGQIAAGAHAEAGQECQDVIEGYPVVLKAVDYGWYRVFFGTALAFYRRPPLPYLQVVWPGSDGSFPWDPRYPEHHRDLQPQLWLAPADHPPGVWTQDL
ncbi:DUF4262 domain-containing protein [Actinoallomurus purpureus]|uniref:DUF4262 domain-containing protein n=1 Tax=Actinoallomurus purpureus TaxID=478114 RepID=UPI002092C481|nr:DUF4262 domain-containing protein [Actinoallomurus purpureus]MCO6009990.1 DUF4262 domain-containing protein [Actinoallomurus purpureus]